MFTLVAGTGYTGRRVLERLPADACLGLNRSPIETDRPFACADFDAAGSLPLPSSANCAVLYTCPPGGDDDARLRRFLEALTPPPRRFVYISTTGVYGDCRGRVVTEDAPLRPQSPLAKPRVAAESHLAEYATASSCRLVILRVPGIYGPGRLGIERIREGGANIREDQAGPGNRIHVDDLVACCLAALEDGTPAGIYNVGDGDHRSATWFADEVARQAGLPEPRKIGRAEAERAFSAMRLAFLASSRVVDTTKMRDVLRVSPRSPEDGIRDALLQERALRETGRTP